MDNKIQKQSTEDSQIYFKMKDLDGDQSIWLGQSILALIALNRSPVYTPEMNKSFTVDLFTSLMEELGITPEDIENNIKIRNENNE